MLNKTQTFRTLCTLLCCSILLLSTGCSTKKNTGATRSFHQFTTRYNVAFNANSSFQNGKKAIEKAQIDDYTRILPMFPISNHDNLTIATSDMDRTIEKCRKAIKNHSITRKPKRDMKQWRKPKYQQFYNQDEFVPGVCEAWITLGKAEFHKGDFIGAVGTFSYIIKHYPNHPETVTEARLWLTRAYAEMEWFYEAEQAFEKVNENSVTRKLTLLYAETKAYLFLNTEKEFASIPFLKLAAERTNDRYQRTRYNYILGQLYALQGKKADAIERYGMVLKSSPPYLMQFNAELQRYQLQAGGNAKAIKGMEKMLKNVNNKEYLDQIYYAIGNSYLERKDTTRALKAYAQGAEKSTRNGIDKAVLLITMGDLYYEQKDYLHAYPCFQEATLLLSNNHDDYTRVSILGEHLGELSGYAETVALQDSLQHLATLSPEEQRKIVDKIIERVIEEEKAAAKKAEDDMYAQMATSQPMATDSRTGAPMGNAGGMLGGATGNWYFYNTGLLTSGKSQFTQRWGSRKLEDNWRRLNKSGMSGSLEDSEEKGDELADNDSGKSTGEGGKEAEEGTNGTSDLKSPEYYLAQIPKSEEQIEQSNQAIASALYGMGEVYANKLNDYPSATGTFGDFQGRFPNDQRKLDSYYYCYQLYGRQEKAAEQERYRQMILTEFPKSNYAIMLSQPDYAERVARMFVMQDSIYLATYDAYSRSEFSTVLANYNLMQRDYSMSPLMPKFAFLSAMSLGKSGSESEFYSALENIVEKYPNSDVTPMSKDIIALMKQGREAQQGSGLGDLIAKRAEVDALEVVDETPKGNFVNDNSLKHLFLLLPKEEDSNVLNKLLYDLAAYNFTKFMVKEFDLEVGKKDGRNYVAVTGFENLEEALWYERMLLAEPLFQGRVTLNVCDRVVISDENLKQIGNLPWSEYKEFQEKEAKKNSKK